MLWPTCMCAISREVLIGFDSTTCIQWLFLKKLSCSRGGLEVSHAPRSPTVKTQEFQFSPAAVSAEPPLLCTSFVVNSEPRTGASPAVRLCVGLITTLGKSRSFIGPPGVEYGWENSQFLKIPIGTATRTSNKLAQCQS